MGLLMGEGERAGEEGLSVFFKNCIARSSPRNNFSFICIDLQNKQGWEGREW
jgi:hypothetical protein